MSKKFSSYKNHQLITESWRKFLNEGSFEDDMRPEEREGGDRIAVAGDDEREAQFAILNKVSEALEAAVGDWINDDDMQSEWPTPGLEDRETFLKELNTFSMANSGISLTDLLKNQ